VNVVNTWSSFWQHMMTLENDDPQSLGDNCRQAGS
jgi:hypothetical protein